MECSSSVENDRLDMFFSGSLFCRCCVAACDDSSSTGDINSNTRELLLDVQSRRAVIIS